MYTSPAGKLTARRTNKQVLASRDESPLVLGDSLPEKYQKILDYLESRKAKKTYCAPEDDIIVCGSRMKSMNKK